MNDTVPCAATTKAGHVLTGPDGVPVVATSNAQDAGGDWMCHARPLSHESEFKVLLMQNGFGKPGDRMLLMIQRLWEAYWKLKQARPAKTVKREPVAMG